MSGLGTAAIELPCVCDQRDPQMRPDVMTCGSCGRSWCARCHPTPAARCPFEYDHIEEDTTVDTGQENDVSDRTITIGNHTIDLSTLRVNVEYRVVAEFSKEIALNWLQGFDPVAIKNANPKTFGELEAAIADMLGEIPEQIAEGDTLADAYGSNTWTLATPHPVTLVR